MSENKCPCCGSDMRKTKFWNVHAWYTCRKHACAFSCRVEHLPRIAAAMDAEARHNALVIEHAALLINHNALVEAVKRMRRLEGGIPEMGMLGAHKMITDVARAEVDRLIADCKGRDAHERGVLGCDVRGK